MSAERSGFVNVDELLPQISIEQVAAFYGVPLPDLHRTGQETRTQCFLLCGKSAESGPRALAIQEGHPAKQWRCHQYGCVKGGNLISLCDLLKRGPNAGGKPRGQRFKEIAADLRAMVEGVVDPAPAPPPAQSLPKSPDPPKVNVPLAKSENERARGLTELDRKFVVDVATMPPAASAYVRRRPFLLPEVCREWRCGYLPRDAGGEDKSGGTMRGSFVYGYRSEDGEVLTWFGRDPEFEAKHHAWAAGGKQGREPEKFHFVKGFHRGLELFGQHGRDRLRAHPEYRETLRQLGLVVVEGPNDVIALDRLGVPAVGLCSNTVTDEQAAKLARFAKEVADGRVTLMLDCDEAGEAAVEHALRLLAEQTAVRLGWSARLFGGRFKGRQPESLTADDWSVVEAHLQKRNSSLSP